MNSEIYQKIVESAEEGIWLIDDSGKTTYVNDKVCQMIGHASEELLGQEMSHFMDSEEYVKLMEKLENRRAGVREQHNVVFRKKDGTRLWVSAACSPLFDTQDKYIGALGLVSDISHRHRNEVLLKSQRNVFEILVAGGTLEASLEQLLFAVEELVEGVIPSILLLNDNGQFTGGVDLGLPKTYSAAINGSYIGPKAGSCGTSAYRKETVIVSDIANDPLWSDYKQIALPHGLAACWSSPITSRTGKVLGTFAMYFCTKRKPTQFELDLVKDITSAAALSVEHIKLLEKEKKHLEEAKKAIKIREDFISIASHELRTPLTSLKARVDLMNMMMAKIQLPEEISQKFRPIIEGIQPDVQKFSKLIETLLDVSKMGESKFFLNKEEVNISHAIFEEAHRLDAEFKKKHTQLDLHIDSDIHGHCDYLRLQQVVANLLMNALKFGEGKPVELHASTDSSKLLLKVVDHGIGIAKEDISRIFEPFERAVSDLHYGGLGLGLFITLQIVESHGGTIRVKSELGKGTTFEVMIPLV